MISNALHAMVSGKAGILMRPNQLTRPHRRQRDLIRQIDMINTRAKQHSDWVSLGI